MGIRAAKAELRRARSALEANGALEDAAGITQETARFHALNRAVIDAEKAVPWWLDDLREIPDRLRILGDNRRWRITCGTVRDDIGYLSGRAWSFLRSPAAWCRAQLRGRPW